MESKTRIAGIIIKDGKLLMVKSSRYKEIWTPGGKVEPGENDEQCLRRELKEEINVELKGMKFFKEYISESFYVPDRMVTQRIYIVSVKGVPIADSEIESIVWLTKQDFKKKKYPMIPLTKKVIIPDLIKQGIF